MCREYWKPTWKITFFFTDLSYSNCFEIVSPGYWPCAASALAVWTQKLCQENISKRQHLQLYKASLHRQTYDLVIPIEQNGLSIYIADFLFRSSENTVSTRRIAQNMVSSLAQCDKFELILHGWGKMKRTPVEVYNVLGCRISLYCKSYSSLLRMNQSLQQDRVFFPMHDFHQAAVLLFSGSWWP